MWLDDCSSYWRLGVDSHPFSYQYFFQLRLCVISQTFEVVQFTHDMIWRSNVETSANSMKIVVAVWDKSLFVWND